MRCPRPCGAEVETKIEALQKELEAHSRAQVPKADKERRAKLASSTRRSRSVAVREALDELDSRVRRPARGRARYLAGRPSDLIRNVGAVPDAGEEEQRDRQAAGRYRARCRASAATWSTSWSPTSERRRRGAPVVEELNPTYGNLIGRIEHIAQMGTLRHRLPADQAGRAASRQRRLSADRRAQAAAVAVRLGGAEARASRRARSASSSRSRRSGSMTRRRRSIPSRSRSTSRSCCSATASSTTC